MPASPEPAKCFDCNLCLFRCNPDHFGAGQVKESIQAFPSGSVFAALNDADGLKPTDG
jgi:hypothetical protein